MDNTNYDSKHTGPEIDAAIDRAKAGGEIDKLLLTKAPAGYGLGGSATKTVETDFNNYIDNGVYTVPGSMESIQNAPPRGAYGMLIVSHGSSAIEQDVYSPDWSSSAVRWNHVRRVCTSYDGNADFWSEWEWPEPPMELGVEYRTTERYLGKPIYKRMIDFGTLPSSGSKEVSVPNADGVMRNISIDLSKSVCTKTDYLNTNLFPSHPSISGFYINMGTVRIETTADYSSWSAQICISYTKSTD